jgi:iron(III) transport system permease protein
LLQFEDGAADGSVARPLPPVTVTSSLQGAPAWRSWRPSTPGTLGWFAVALAAVLAVPVVYVASKVFAAGGGSWHHLVETVLADYVWNTLWLALGVGIGVMIVGVGTAWLVTMCRFRGSQTLEWALILPLAVPAYVMAYAYTDFLQFSGPLQTWLRDLTGWRAREYWFPDIRSLGGAVTVMVFVLYPYVYLLARTAFLEQSVGVLEVGRTLGYGAWGSFLRIALPLARPAIAAGTSLALMETLADFGTVSYFAVPTFTTGIYRAWFSMGDPVAAAQLSAMLLGFVACVLLLERVTRGRARYHNATSRRRLPEYRLGGWRAVGALLACLAPLVIGFLLPAAILLRMTLAQGDEAFGERFVILARNSVSLALIASVLAILLALLMAYAARLRPGPITLSANRLAGLGYAIPGTVIAVGILVPVSKLDHALDAFVSSTFGLSTGLLLTGGVAALVYAYLVRFFSVALQTVEAGLTRITSSMEAAARSLGCSPAAVLKRVHAPLITGSLLTAGLMVFVDVMKELPATYALRPFNFDTLAVHAYNLAADERLAEAATASLAIVAVGLVPLVFLSRSIGRSRARS